MRGRKPIRGEGQHDEMMIIPHLAHLAEFGLFKDNAVARVGLWGVDLDGGAKLILG